MALAVKRCLRFGGHTEMIKRCLRFGRRTEMKILVRVLVNLVCVIGGVWKQGSAAKFN